MGQECKSGVQDWDMLDHSIVMKDPEGCPVAPPAVSVDIGTFIGAGADTTAIRIAVVIGQLATHPNEYRRVQQGIDAVHSEHDADDSWT